MQNLVDLILEQPNAPSIIEEAKTRLEKEKESRQHFYAIIDENTKAEFVNGQIIYHSPVKKEHNDVASGLFFLLKGFVAKFKLGYLGFDKLMVSLTRNDFEPDICFFDNEKSQHFVKGQMHFPAPDLAVEVLSSNEQHDREVKYKDYQLHGVREYWIIDPNTETIEQYLLEEEAYQLNLKATDGHIESTTVKGFRIPIRAIFDEEKGMEALMTLLQKNIEA
ncbi:MAG: Uma2 family endonuclease [Bacteroidota bacterium]